MRALKFLNYFGLLSAIAIASGCGQNISNKVQNSNVNLDLGNDLVQVVSDDGSISEFGTGASIPEDWPADVPFPEQITVTVATTLNGGYNVVFTSDAPPDVIIGYYEAELAARGWSIGDATTTATLSSLRATKAERTIDLTSINNANGQGNTTTLSVQTSN